MKAMNSQDMPQIESMVWGRDKPKKAGFYFWRFDSASKTEIVEVKETETENPNYWQVLTTRRGPQFLGFMMGEWSGPIKLPNN